MGIYKAVQDGLDAYSEAAISYLTHENISIGSFNFQQRSSSVDWSAQSPWLKLAPG